MSIKSFLAVVTRHDFRDFLINEGFLDNKYEFLVDYFQHLTHFRLSLRIEPVDDPQLIECIIGNR